MTPDEVTCGPRGDTCAVCVITALGLAVAIALSTIETSGNARSSRPPAFDPSRFILNALLVPALDADAVPFRWVDPRPALALWTRYDGAREPRAASGRCIGARHAVRARVADGRMSPLRCARAAVRRTGSADGVQGGLGIQRRSRAVGPAGRVARKQDHVDPARRGFAAAIRRRQRIRRVRAYRFRPIIAVTIGAKHKKQNWPPGEIRSAALAQ